VPALLGLEAGGRPGDELAEERIVVEGDVESLLDAAVPADSGSGGQIQPPHRAGGGEEALEGILRGDAAFDGVALEGHLVLAEGERLAGGHPELPLDQVHPRDQLRHRMLHLDAGIHLHEVEFAVLVEELDGARALVVHRLGGPHRRLAHGVALLGREHR